MSQFLHTRSTLEDWLQSQKIYKYVIHPDLSVDALQSISFGCQNLKCLPVRFRSVEGNFHCSYNQLTTLEGCPQYVAGDFTATDNCLTSLQGGPLVVKGNYEVAHNQLTSLEYLASEIGASLYVSNNELSSLEFCPKTILNSFDCAHNQLVSLKGGPQTVGNVFNCRGNQLRSLEFCPIEVDHSFRCDSNQIETVAFSPQKMKQKSWFSCSGNPLLGELQTIETFEPFYQAHKNFVIAQQEKTHLEQNIEGNKMKTIQLFKI